MEYSTTTRKVVVPRCETCNGRFQPKSKVFCADCNVKIHYDCAVYADDDSQDMLCLNCYKNEKIRQGLEKDGILVKVEGDDLCRVYKGKSFWEEEEKKVIITDEDCPYELECEVISDSDDDSCGYCGWRSEYPESHVEHGNWKCKYIKDKYILKLDDEGDLVWEEKPKVCAFGYCREDLYRRGCLANWRDLWICNECSKDIKYLDKLEKI